MPDISLCTNQNCPSKEKCYRFKVKPSKEWQTYAEFKPEQKDKDKCEYFMKIYKNK